MAAVSVLPITAAAVATTTAVAAADLSIIGSQGAQGYALSPLSRPQKGHLTEHASLGAPRSFAACITSSGAPKGVLFSIVYNQGRVYEVLALSCSLRIYVQIEKAL